MTTAPASGTASFTAAGTKTVGTRTVDGDYVYRINLAGTGATPTNGLAGKDLITIEVQSDFGGSWQTEVVGIYQGVTTLSKHVSSPPTSATGSDDVRLKITLSNHDAAGTRKFKWKVEKIDA